MMPAIWLRAYRRPDFVEDCATTDQITAIQRKLIFVRSVFGCCLRPPWSV